VLRPIAEIRAVLMDFMRHNPGSPLASRLDLASGRWLPVPAAELDAHLDAVLVTAADPDPDNLEQHIADGLATAAVDLPLMITAGPSSLLILFSHAVGDAVTLTRLVHAIAGAEPDGLSVLTHRVGIAAPALALARGLRPHHRDWIRYLRHRSGPPAADVTGTMSPARPAFTGTTMSNAALRDLTRWRNANAHGVSMTSVLASIVHRALRLRDVRIHDQGLCMLIDIRSLLPASPRQRWGNLSKSLYLEADLTDPGSIEAALRQARSTDRVLPATVAGGVASILSRPQSPASASPGAAPVLLTFNSIPTLPGLAELPWRDATNRRFYGFGRSPGPAGITVTAVRHREYMELTASFDEAIAATATVHSALEALADPADLLSAQI
jgi:hypothetical protein